MATASNQPDTSGISAPQNKPMTLGYTKMGSLENYEYFFGAPVSPEKIKDYTEHHALTYHFPDAYAGSNTKIRDTLNNLILKSPQSWQTSVGLPFFQLEGTVVEWDEISFDVRLLQRVPYEGVSRMQTSLRRRHRDRVVRRGLALIIESDFYATDAGRQHFADQLTSIRYCVQETCNFDVLHAYLSSTNYDMTWDFRKGLRNKRNIKQAMNHEIMLYGICQKEQMGFDKCVEECKYRMSRYGVTPNMLVLPPQLLLYMSLAPEQKLTYKEGGPAAEARFEGGMAGFEARTFRGCGVFTSEPFEVSDDQDSVQMLTRSSQIGEFYTMQPPQTDPGKFAKEASDKREANMNTCDVLIYDEESDRHVRITWADALRAATLGLDNEDKLKFGDDEDVAMAGAKNGKIQNLREWAAAAAKWAAFNEGKEQGGYTYEQCCDYGGRDVRIVLARPFIEHLMHSVVLTVAGRDTGATLFGPADMQLSANTQVKTIEGHYTGHFKAVVTKPQNVMVMRDVSCSGYVAGGNTKFFCNPNNGDAQTTVQAIQSRLSFTDTDDPHPSLLAFACLHGQVEHSQIDTVMSVTTRQLPWDVTGVSPGNHKSFPGGEKVFRWYNSLLNLGQIHYGEDVQATENVEFLTQGSTNNAVCFVGPHRLYDAFTKSFMSLVPGQGHFGPDAIPGDARWRRGESVSLKAARDAMVSLELAQHAQMVYSKP